VDRGGVPEMWIGIRAWEFVFGGGAQQSSY
jgi:hypothetical protein